MLEAAATWGVPVGAGALRMLRTLLGQARAGSSRASGAGGNRSMGSIVHGREATTNGNVFRVLFCGEEFRWGYQFSKEALAGDPGFEVGCFITLDCIRYIATGRLWCRMMPVSKPPSVGACCRLHAECCRL
jgi:hypothetical protein